MGTFDKNDLSVYIHIPFSIKNRPGENTLVVPSTRETHNAYLAALDREMMAAGDVLDGHRVASISIGGGIATVVSPDQLARMILKFKRTYHVAPGAELSVTAAPQTLVTPCLSGLNMCNVNCIRLIALSPVDALLETINAPHRLADIENGTFILGKFGYSNIDAVLMYGIPGQTLTTIRNTLLAFASLKGLKHITLQRYELSEVSGVSWEACEAQYQCAVEVLADKGLYPYTGDSFSRKGWESHFVMHELLGMERIGFGLGAKSYLDQMVFQNTTDFDLYLRNSDDYTRVITEAVAMNDLDQMKRYVALRLQLVDGFSEQAYCEEFGMPLERGILSVIERLANAGLVCRTNDQIQLTNAGRVRSNEVISTVIAGEQR